MTCPLCKNDKSVQLKTYNVAELSSLWEKMFSFNPLAELEEKRLQKMQCLSCKIIYFNPAFYGDGDFYKKLSKYPWYYEDNKWEFEKALNILMDIKPNSLLEVGCGAGCFLEKVNGAIEDAQGIDINPAAIQQCSNKGLNVRKSDMSDIDRSYDAIVLFEVLEHMEFLSDVMNQCFKCLAPNGTLIIAVPNPEGYLKDIDVNLLDMPPHHNSSWPKSTFDYIASHYCFEVQGYYKEPLRYVHYLGYMSNILQEHKNMMLPGMKKKLFSFGQSAAINLLAPFYYIQHREMIVGQTHLIVLKKK